MSRRVPVVATLIVGLAIAAMIALGFWQLQRRHEKEALLARYAANMSRPAVAPAALWPLDDAALFRMTSANCLAVTGWKAAAGHSASDVTGWSHVATCRTGAEGPGFAADMGISSSPDAPKWRGGPVHGRVVWAPDGQPLIARLFAAPVARTPLIVSATPAPGLIATAQPDPGSVPNNHLAYAVQWFLFAGVAAVVYAVALARRARGIAPHPPRSS